MMLIVLKIHLSLIIYNLLNDNVNNEPTIERKNMQKWYTRNGRKEMFKNVCKCKVLHFLAVIILTKKAVNFL